MPLKFLNQIQSSNIPAGLTSVDVRRQREKEKNNLSKKIEKLYGSSIIQNNNIIFIGLENGINVLGTESNVGLGVEK
jgi:hypothetical protein